jgi:undecaprenyl-diphosphatase
MIVASIPVILCGLALFLIDMTVFDAIKIMAWMTIIFGVVLYIADRQPQSDIKIENFTFKHAIIYGLFQCIALIPGVSRSGITMTAGRFMGHSRTQAARFSMMMGMVTITAAGTLGGVSVFQDSAITSQFLMMMSVGIIVSAITAYIAILCMMRWFNRNGSMTPFVIYRVILGGGLLALIYGGMI